MKWLCLRYKGMSLPLLTTTSTTSAERLCGLMAGYAHSHYSPEDYRAVCPAYQHAVCCCCSSAQELGRWWRQFQALLEVLQLLVRVDAWLARIGRRLQVGKGCLDSLFVDWIMWGAVNGAGFSVWLAMLASWWVLLPDLLTRNPCMQPLRLFEATAHMLLLRYSEVPAALSYCVQCCAMLCVAA